MTLARGFALEPSGAEDGRLGLRVRVEATHPCFTGHFPGEPILPGIAQLGLVLLALETLLGSRWRLVAVRSLRLRRLVRPGDRLQLSLDRPGADGSLRFELRAGSDVVSSGALSVTRG